MKEKTLKKHVKQMLIRISVVALIAVMSIATLPLFMIVGNVYAITPNTIPNLKQAVDNAQGTYNQLANEEELLQQDYNEKTQLKETAQTADDEATTELLSAQQNKESKQAAKEVANETKIEAQNNLATAQSNLTTATTNLQEAITEVSNKQSAFDNAETAYNNALAQINKGSFGFFEEKNATRALNALNRTGYNNTTEYGDEYTSYTEQGNPNDATSLDSMKESIEWIKHSNTLRVGEGYSTLKITHELMASAQANANYSSSHYEHAPMELRYNGENLYVSHIGYERAYQGWYWDEKEIFDSKVAADPSFERYRQNAIGLMQNDVNTYYRVGHYLNIIDEDAVATGIGLSYKNRKAAIQHFAAPYYCSGETQYTVDDYEEMFMEYYRTVKEEPEENLSNAQSALDDANAEKEIAQTAKTNAESNYNTALSAFNNAESALDQATRELNDAETRLANAQNRKQQTTAALSSAVTSVEHAQNALEDKQAQLESANIQLASASDRLTNATDLSKAGVDVSPTEYSYDGNIKTPNVIVSIPVPESSDVNIFSQGDYTLSYIKDGQVVDNPRDAGQYTIRIDAASSGQGIEESGVFLHASNSTKSFTINKKELSANMVEEIDDVTYNGIAQTPEVLVKDGLTNLVKDRDYHIDYSSNTNAGEATVTIIGEGNYTGSISKTFTITPKAITKEMVGAIGSVAYDGEPQKPDVVVADGDKTLEKGTDYDVKYTNNIGIGTASVVIAGKGNYTGSIECEFEIVSPEMAELQALIDELENAKAGETDEEFIAAIDDALNEAREAVNGTNTDSEYLNSIISSVRSKRAAALSALEEKKEAARLAEEEAAKKAEAAARANQSGQGGAVGKGASIEYAEKAIISSTSDEGPKGSKYAPLQLRSTKQAKTSVTLTWNKVSGAKNYVIYGNVCGKKNKMQKITTSTGKSFTVKKLANKKALKKGTYHKFMIVALDSKNNVISTSKVVHVATKGNKKIANPTKITLKAPKTLKKGKTHKLAAKQVGIFVKKHRGLAYETSNDKVATVSKGKIKAKGKGKCYVYVYAQNGVFKKVKVTVK